jgi:hypothetical protein
MEIDRFNIRVYGLLVDELSEADFTFPIDKKIALMIRASFC